MTPAPWIDPSLRFFHVKTNVEVTWGATERSCIYHATFDGKEALCRRSIRLVSENPYPSIWDPSRDIMACELCQGLVRRVVVYLNERERHIDKSVFSPTGVHQSMVPIHDPAGSVTENADLYGWQIYPVLSRLSHGSQSLLVDCDRA